MNIIKSQTFFLSLLCAAIAILSSCHDCQHCHEHQSTTQAQTKTIFSFLGAPGSGKGTLSDLVVKQLDFKTVSAGNLCREEIASGSEKGKLIAQYTNSAKLVPDEIITQMIEQWLSKQTGNTPIILDGYPRTKHQAELLADLLKTKFTDYRLRVISLQIDDEEEVVKRISNRLICSNKQCQAIYNRALLKDAHNLVCEKCGSKLTQRDDDKEAVVRKRLQEFNKNNIEIIDFYLNTGIMIEPLPASHTTAQETFERFKQLLAHP